MRDFNAWHLAEGCDATVATATGPLFTYAVMWAGAALLRGGAVRRRRLGFILIFASLPLGRILTAVLGGGDEINVLNAWASLSPFPLYLLNLLIVGLFGVPPLVVAFRAMGPARKVSRFASYLVVPFVADVLIVLVVMNAVLGAGVLATPVVAGTPLLIWVYLMVLAAALAGTGRALWAGAAEGHTVLT